MGGDVNSRWEEAVVFLGNSFLIGLTAATIKTTGQICRQPQGTRHLLIDNFSNNVKIKFGALNEAIVS